MARFMLLWITYRSIHKITKARKMMKSIGEQVVFLSPYFPDLNSIENC